MKFMKIALSIYILLLHIFIVITFMKTDIFEKIQEYFGIEVVKEEIRPYFYHMLGFHKRIDANIPKNSIIAIGDSLMQGLAIESLHPMIFNFGIGEDTTLGVLKRVPQYNSIKSSKLVILAIGLNDLKRRTNSEIIKNYINVINMIPSHTKILVSAIHPVNSLQNSKLKNYNKRISDINTKLKQISQKSERLYFIDISENLSDIAGNLSIQYNIGDGVHLNKSANQIWLSALKESINNIISNESD